MGSRLISLKGDSFAWRGKTTQGVSDRGERRFLRLQNCYVSGDGTEIRRFPGWRTLWDNSPENNIDGWAGHYTYDAVLPIFNTSPAEPGQIQFQPSPGNVDRILTLRSRALPVHYHGFDQVGDTIVVWGESRFREIPIYGLNGPIRVQVAPTAIFTGAMDVVGLSLNVGVAPFSTADSTGVGMNSVAVGNVVYLTGLTTANPLDQAILDLLLNGRIHVVAGIGAMDITITTQLPAPLTAALTAGSIHVVRPNRVEVYPTDEPSLAYDFINPDRRPDDPDALTSWRLVGPLDPTATAKQCYPAHVANRRRDFGDRIDPVAWYEGIFRSAGRGNSRREQRSLPLRTVGIEATDRLILGAPGYGCMFQIPLKVQSDPSRWPTLTATDGLGVPAPNNSIYDCPRALGVPKARMVEALSATVPPTGGFVDANFAALFSNNANGLTEAGLWRICISFEDEITGEEGLPSEVVSVDLPAPAATKSWFLRVSYIHPGYVMPESLCLKMNVYLATPGSDALLFYSSFPLRAAGNSASTGWATLNATSYERSAAYGNTRASAGNNFAIARSFALPLGGTNAEVAAILQSRFPPQSASMPRGAEAAKMIRGVLLAGGNSGNSGPSRELWESKVSLRYNTGAGSSFDKTDEVHLRTHGADYIAPSSTTDTGGAFGLAGRAFPDAYGGTELYAPAIAATSASLIRSDRVLNRKCRDLIDPVTLNVGNMAEAADLRADRLRVTRPVVTRTQTDLYTPATLPTTAVLGAQAFWLEPKGQLQIGDPGAPGRSGKDAIQFVDAARGDDIVAIGNIAGVAVVCTRRETYTFSWYRNPRGEIPNLVSNEHGCVAPNSMVEFDGGVAWLAERGPVAMGDGLQFIGQDIQEDFHGSARRYQQDSKGMLRAAWGTHDARRGLVMWGISTNENAASIIYQGYPGGGGPGASDEILSRLPCDEVLIWSYRANAFSTWRPPVGLEIYWMRPIRIKGGELVMAFLAADGRIYMLDDAAADTNLQPAVLKPRFAVNGTTVPLESVGHTIGRDGMPISGRNGGSTRLIRPGMFVMVTQLVKGREVYVGQTKVASITTINTTQVTLVNNDAFALTVDHRLYVGLVPEMDIITTYVGAETMDNLSPDSLQMRCTSRQDSTPSFSSISAITTDGQALRYSSFTNGTYVETTAPVNELAVPGVAVNIPASKRFRFPGRFDAPEAAIRVQQIGGQAIQIADLSLEVG